MRTLHRSRRSGFTLVELAIVALLISVLMAAVGLFESTNRQTIEQSSAVGSAQERAHAMMERVLRELGGASTATLVPDPISAQGSDEIVFQKSTGVTNAGVVIWSTRTRIALEPEDGETLDGTDDNHNGLVDECRLVLTHDFGTAAARTLVLGHRLPAHFPGETTNGADDNGNGVIDESGFSVQRVGNLLRVRLATQVRGVGRNWVSWQEDSSLRLRN